MGLVDFVVGLEFGGTETASLYPATGAASWISTSLHLTSAIPQIGLTFRMISLVTEIIRLALLIVSVLSVAFFDGTKLLSADQRHGSISIFESHRVISLSILPEGRFSLEWWIGIAFIWRVCWIP